MAGQVPGTGRGPIFQHWPVPPNGTDPRSGRGNSHARPTRDLGMTALDVAMLPAPAATGTAEVTHNLEGVVDILVSPSASPQWLYNMSGETEFTVSPSAVMRAPISIPAPPAPAPPEELGVFPMPTAGGVTVRALVSKTVTMDDPVIVDGKPT